MGRIVAQEYLRIAGNVDLGHDVGLGCTRGLPSCSRRGAHGRAENCRSGDDEEAENRHTGGEEVGFDQWCLLLFGFRLVTPGWTGAKERSSSRLRMTLRR